jgi:hypothetical protein
VGWLEGEPAGFWLAVAGTLLLALGLTGTGQDPLTTALLTGAGNSG